MDISKPQLGQLGARRYSTFYLFVDETHNPTGQKRPFLTISVAHASSEMMQVVPFTTRQDTMRPKTGSILVPDGFGNVSKKRKRPNELPGAYISPCDICCIKVPSGKTKPHGNAEQTHLHVTRNLQKVLAGCILSSDPQRIPQAYRKQFPEKRIKMLVDAGYPVFSRGDIIEIPEWHPRLSNGPWVIVSQDLINERLPYPDVVAVPTWPVDKTGMSSEELEKEHGYTTIRDNKGVEHVVLVERLQALSWSHDYLDIHLNGECSNRPLRFNHWLHPVTRKCVRCDGEAPMWPSRIGMTSEAQLHQISREIGELLGLPVV